MDINDREIAFLIWLSVFLAWVFIHPNMRPSAFGVLKAFLQIKIVIPLALLCTYLGLVVWGLHAIGLWDWDQLKNTFVWSIVVGFASFFQLQKIESNPNFFREWVRDTIRVIVVVEFLVNFYTFPLVTELILLPLLTLLFAMIAIGEREPKYAPAVRLFNFLTTTFGLVLIGYSGYRIWTDFDDFASVATVRDFYTPILLSILFTPFIFVLHVYAVYESVFLMLNWSIKNPALRRYAKSRGTLAFGPRTRLLRRWQKYLGSNKPRDRADIRESIASVLAARRREKNPTPVPAVRGWSPQVAIEILADDGLQAGDYHKSFDESWTASSPMKEIGDGVFADNIAYYLEGDELVVTRISLKLNVNNLGAPQQSLDRYVEIGAKLLQWAAGNVHFDITKPMEMTLPYRHISVERFDWTGRLPGYDLTLIIRVNEPDDPQQDDPVPRPA